VPVGRYQLKARKLGFLLTSRDIEINAGKIISPTLVLRIDEVEEQVTITATRSIESIAAIPGSITVISNENLLEQNGVSVGLSDALGKLVPGLALSNQSNSIFGQTLRGRTISVLIDGIPQSTSRNVQRDLSTIDFSAVERVEVLRGPTAIYGDGATGGVINIITKTPRQAGYNFSTDLGLSSSLTHPKETVGGYIRQLSAGKSSRYDFVTSVAVDGVSGFFDAEGDRIPSDPHGQGGTSDTNSYNLFAKVGTNFRREQRLQLTFNRFDSTQNTKYTTDPSVNILPGRQKARAIKGIELETPQGTENNLINLDYSNSSFLGSRLNAQGFYRNYSTRFFPFNRGRFVGTGDSRTKIIQSFVDSEKFGGRIQVETPLKGEGGPVVVWGGDFYKEKTSQPVLLMDQFQYEQSGGRRFQNIGQLGWTPLIKQNNVGLFAQGEWRVHKRLLLRSGLRHERIDVDIDDFTTLSNNLISGGTLTYDDILFNAGAVFNINEPVSVFANFSQGFSIADLGRLLREAPAGLNVESFRPEAQKVNNIEVGVRGYWRSLQSSLSLFYNRSNLGTTYLPDLTVVRAPEKIYGAEADINIQASNSIRLGGTGTWIEGKHDPNRDDIYTYLSSNRIFPLKITSYIEHDTHTRWTNRLQAVYSGKRNRFNNSLQFGLAPVEDYATVDWVSRLKVGTGILRVSIENILNRQYYPPASQWWGEDSSYAAGRGAVLSVGYSFSY
jgi:iron complex outermembrane recepter protein